MGCYDNYIGIKSCNITNSTSGKYLEDLGISIVKLSALSNESNLTGFNYGQQKIMEAIDYVLADIQPDYNSTPVAGSLNEVGDSEVDYNGSVVIKSLCKDARIRIDKVTANCVNQIDTTLIIKDGSTLTEFEFNTSDDLYIDYKAKNKSIELYIDDINYLPYNIYSSCEWINNCCKDVSYTQGQTGLQIDFSLVCDFSCRLRNDNNFKNAVLYMCGVLISQDLRLSSNLNEVVRFSNQEKSDEREDIWMAMYEKYAEKVRSVFVDLIDNSCCKTCEGYGINWYL